MPTNIHYQNKNEIKKTNFDSTILISKWAIKNNIHLFDPGAGGKQKEEEVFMLKKPIVYINGLIKIWI